MEKAAQAVKPKVKRKTFTYQTSIEWLGEKAGNLSSENKDTFRVASPPEFKGESGVWTPEDLFVAAIDSCVLMTFSTFAKHRKLMVQSYTSNAEGFLEFVDGGYRFTRVVLRPQVVLQREEDRELAETVLRDAHQKCLISNSISATVIVEPECIVSSATEGEKDDTL